MPDCPRCQVPLRTIHHAEGIYFSCNTCHGRAVTIPQIRRAGGDRFATSLFRQIDRSQITSTLGCPFCSQPMCRLAHQEPALELDACRRCTAVWFDPLEFEALPQRAPPAPTELERRCAELIAQHQNTELREGTRDPSPEETWKWLPGVLGMPVEMSAPLITRNPVATWTLAVVCTVCSLLAFTRLEAAIEHWGLIPAEWWRYGGLTFVSSFLVHGSWLHLLSNLYFLLVFGDKVEDYLGRARMLLLLFAATLAGDALHILADPRSTLPAIGASGGISGIIVFYALQFPRVKLGLFLLPFFRWIQIPTWGALIAWILLQVVGAADQSRGLGDVSALAHLGGAATGFVAWLFWHRMEARQPRSPSDEG